MEAKRINLSELANKYQAWMNCIKSGNKEWESKHEDRVNEMLGALPHGSGIDAGVKFDWHDSRVDKLVFTLGFHHMDEHGGYDGWTEHSVVVTPDFVSGFKIRITGRDRNMIKDYLHDLFYELFYTDIYYSRKKEIS